MLIEWLDSGQPVSRWEYLSEYERADALHCESVGWLIQDDDTKVLAPNMGEINDSERIQACGLIRIPACAVIRIVRLTRGRSLARGRKA